MIFRYMQKLRKSRLFMTIVFFYTIHLIIYLSSSYSNPITASSNVGNSADEGFSEDTSANSNSQQDSSVDDTPDEVLFKAAEVPGLINFDLYDVKNFFKSKFQNPDKLLGELVATIQDGHFEVAGDDVIPSYLSYSDYNVNVPDRESASSSFDIKLTISAYLNYVKTKYDQKNETIELPFHWFDWVNLTSLNDYIDYNKQEGVDKSVFDCNYVSTVGSDQEADQSSANKYCKDEEGIKSLFPGYSQNKNSPLNFNVFKWSERNLEESKAVQSRSYLYSGAKTPVSIIFMTNTSSEDSYDNIGIYEFKVKNGNTVGNAERLSENYDSFISPLKDDSHVNPIVYLDRLASSYGSSKKDPFPLSEEHELTLSTKFFNYDAADAISSQENKLDKLDSSSLEYYKKQQHLESLKYSEAMDEGAITKYFHEVPIYSMENNEKVKSKAGNHYDWRFFRGLIHSDSKKRRILHHLTRSFLKFTFARRMPAWVAHGSLLGWYWNSLNFPWDGDVDVQMSIYHLQSFCEAYNQTLVVENLYDGLGRYFVDCGSTMTHRTKGSGKNNIDARFIDIDTGMYIDITGLAVSSEELPATFSNLRKRKVIDPPKPIKPATIIHSKNDDASEERFAQNERLLIYNCRNKHFVFHHQLAPLKLTHFEGVLSFVPHKYQSILKDEYKNDPLTNQDFNNHYFSKTLRQWIHIDKFKRFFRMKIKQNGHYRNGLNKNLHSIDKNIDDLLEFLKFDESVLIQFARNEYVTKQHNFEMSKNKLLMHDFRPNLEYLFLGDTIESPHLRELLDSNIMAESPKEDDGDDDSP